MSSFSKLRDYLFGAKKSGKAKKEKIAAILCRFCGQRLGLNSGTSLSKMLLYNNKAFGNLLLCEAGVYLLYMPVKHARIAHRCSAVRHRACDCRLVRSVVNTIARGRYDDHAAPTAPLERFVVRTRDVLSELLGRPQHVAALALIASLLVEYHKCTFDFLNRRESSKKEDRARTNL